MTEAAAIIGQTEPKRLKFERVGTTRVREMTGFSLRKVQLLAEQGKIPSAARLAGGCWTFDESVVRDWIKKGEQEACRTISIGGERLGTPGSKFEARSIDRAYEQILKQRRKRG